jgi:tRNA threonylcarbamoyladenosine biosynthesis protein TsaB
MKLLALDTSTTTARVALLDESGATLAAAARTADRHSQALLGLCDEVLRARGLRVADVDAFAAGAGPGSFTGLRVGLAAIKGFAFATGQPVVLVSSLAALADDLAAAAPARATVVACLDAGKGELYAQPFSAGAAADDEWRIMPDELARRVVEAGRAGIVAVGGPGVARHREALASIAGALVDVDGPSAHAIGRRALARLARGERDDVDAAVPSYGRPPDITEPKRRP